MPWPVQEYAELPALPEAVTYAPKHARRVLAEGELVGPADNVELVVCELVTSAIGAALDAAY